MRGVFPQRHSPILKYRNHPGVVTVTKGRGHTSSETHCDCGWKVTRYFMLGRSVPTGFMNGYWFQKDLSQGDRRERESKK